MGNNLHGGIMDLTIGNTKYGHFSSYGKWIPDNGKITDIPDDNPGIFYPGQYPKTYLCGGQTLILMVNWDAKGDYMEFNNWYPFDSPSYDAREFILSSMGLEFNDEGDVTPDYQSAYLFEGINADWFKQNHWSNANGTGFLPTPENYRAHPDTTGDVFWNGNYEWFENNMVPNQNGEFDDGDDSIHWHLHPSQHRLGMEFLKIYPGREIK